MTMKQVGILIFVALVLFAMLCGARVMISTEKDNSALLELPLGTTTGQFPPPEPVGIAPSSNSPTTTTSAVDMNMTRGEIEDVRTQPAYLVEVFARDGKYFVTLDYVEWLRGEGQREAMIQDGKCTPEDCYVYPNGYKRNKNPMLRELPLAMDATVELRGALAMQSKSYPYIATVSHEELFRLSEEIEGMAMTPDPAFAKSKTFVTVDVRDGAVTKLLEPYQE